MMKYPDLEAIVCPALRMARHSKNCKYCLGTDVVYRKSAKALESAAQPNQEAVPSQKLSAEAKPESDLLSLIHDLSEALKEAYRTEMLLFQGKSSSAAFEVHDVERRRAALLERVAKLEER